uniref:cannabinoid receptor type 1A-like n=1 Tax=Myxine glutinosa TaxID=7769 RepID=UPI00358FC10B
MKGLTDFQALSVDKFEASQQPPITGPIGPDRWPTNGSSTSLNCSGNFMDMECFMILTREQQAAIGILTITLGFFTVLENALVLFVIFRTPSLRGKPSYLFLSSLAIADLLASVIFVYSFTDFHVFHRKDTEGVFLFKLGGVTASFTASVCSLFLTAIDRYISIHRPLSYRTIVTRGKAVIALGVMWLLAVVTGTLPLLGWNCRRLRSICSDIFPLIDERYLLSWIGLVALLLLIIVYAYVFILWKAHVHTTTMMRRATALKRMSQAEKRKADEHRMDIRLAKTLVLILATLIFCWGPVLVIMVYDVFWHIGDFTKMVFAFCSMLCLMNATINPIIYALRSRDLRRACVLVFCPPQSTTQVLDSSHESDVQGRSLASDSTSVAAARDPPATINTQVTLLGANAKQAEGV